MFCWEPEWCYFHKLCTAIVPFWFSMKHKWTALMELNAPLAHNRRYDIIVRTDVDFIESIFFIHFLKSQDNFTSTTCNTQQSILAPENHKTRCYLCLLNYTDVVCSPVIFFFFFLLSIDLFLTEPWLTVFCNSKRNRQLRARRTLSISKDILLEPEGRYHCTMSMAIGPFWFSTEHLWITIAPFWLSTDGMCWFLTPWS